MTSWFNERFSHPICKASFIFNRKDVEAVSRIKNDWFWARSFACFQSLMYWKMCECPSYVKCSRTCLQILLRRLYCLSCRRDKPTFWMLSEHFYPIETRTSFSTLMIRNMQSLVLRKLLLDPQHRLSRLFYWKLARRP